MVEKYDLPTLMAVLENYFLKNEIDRDFSAAAEVRNMSLKDLMATNHMPWRKIQTRLAHQNFLNLNTVQQAEVVQLFRKKLDKGYANSFLNQLGTRVFESRPGFPAPTTLRGFQTRLVRELMFFESAARIAKGLEESEHREESSRNSHRQVSLSSNRSEKSGKKNKRASDETQRAAIDCCKWCGHLRDNMHCGSKANECRLKGHPHWVEHSSAEWKDSKWGKLYIEAGWNKLPI